MHVPKAARNLKPEHFAIQNKGDRVAVQRGLIDFNDLGVRNDQMMRRMDRAIMGQAFNPARKLMPAKGIGLGVPYEPAKPTIMPSTPRQFLKGLAKLRRGLSDTNDITNMDRMKNAKVYNEYGDLIVGAIAFRPKQVQSNPFDSLQRLGSGYHAKVYALDDYRVIKVINPGYEHTKYDRFVDVAIQNPHNPHLPRVYYRGTWGKHRVYVMERLTENKREVRESFTRLLHLADNPFVKFADNAVLEAITLLNKNGLTDDFRTDNTLMRGDTVVITDPVAG